MSRITKPLPFFHPAIGKAERRAVDSVLRSGWLTTGHQAQAFEEEFADFLSQDSLHREKTQALAVSSATAGLHLALEALGIHVGDFVAVPTVTFTASAEIIRYLGAAPVFVDSDQKTGNLSLESLENVLREGCQKGRRIKAIIVVHLGGRPCPMPQIRALAENYDCAIVEDAAHAFPSSTSEGYLGTLGDIGVFSFYATKTITTGEGGMVVSRNSELVERMRVMRLHGIDRSVWNRYSAGAGQRSWEYDVVAPGYKYNMTDMAATLGRVQLSKAKSLWETRLSLVDLYLLELGGIPDIVLPERCEGHAWHLFQPRFPASVRNALADILNDAGIGTSLHFIPLHRMTYWKGFRSGGHQRFPGAERHYATTMSLPLWPGMGGKAVRRVCRVIRTNMANVEGCKR